MAEQTNLSKKDAEAALKAFIDVVSEELKKGEKVQLVALVPSKYPKEQQEKEEIRRLARPWKSKSFQNTEIQSRKSFKGHDELK